MRGIDYIFHRIFLKPLLQLYLRGNRQVAYDGFRLTVKKGVFHPLLFFSTKFLYGFLKEQELAGKKFLEIGCGSGLLSLLAYREGASVTTIDIDARAVECTRINFEKNFGAHNALIIESDVFENVPKSKFDIVLINPPYYFKKVQHPNQQAWYCGQDGEYFRKLFAGLKGFTHSGSEIFMVLEENCDVEKIKKLAAETDIIFKFERERQIRWERNFIFRLSDASKKESFK